VPPSGPGHHDRERDENRISDGKYNLPFDLEEIGFGAHNRRKKRWSIMTAIIEFKPPGHAWRRRLPVK
jgi:hypothetical protein